MTAVQQQDSLEQATFGAGCFWGAEATFRALPGDQQRSLEMHGANSCLS